MKIKNRLLKILSVVSAAGILFSAVGGEGISSIASVVKAGGTPTPQAEQYIDFTDIDGTFEGAFYDDATTDMNKNATAALITDETVSSLENYSKYTQNGYSSVADYLFSKDSDGNLVRDNDTGVSGNKKVGFLYFKEKYTNFTLSFEYRHNMATKSVGWRSMYVGFGGSSIGSHVWNDVKGGGLRLQPKEMYFYNGNTEKKNYTNDSVFKQSVTAQYEKDLADNTNSWYTFTITVSDNKATWSVNGKEYSQNLSGYIGGYVYIGAMTVDTAFRNMKIKKLEAQEPGDDDYKNYSAYYVKNGSNITNTDAVSTDFTNAWSYDNGLFTRIGVGDFEAGPDGRNGESLLYFKDKKYKDFELTLDYSFGGTSTTWKWAAVGFGATDIGKDLTDGDGYLAFVEKEGFISYNYYENSEKKGGRIKNSENADYKDIVNGSTDASWHSLKITVKEGVLSVGYDNITPVTKAIDECEGYIYLYCFTPNMQFKNITITELSNDIDKWSEGYASYYLPNGKDVRDTDAVFTEGDANKLWTHTDDMLIRSGEGEFAGGSKGAQGPAALYFKDSYKNFVFEYDYNVSEYSGSTWRWVTAGFGASELGSHYVRDNGYLLLLENEGKRSYFTKDKPRDNISIAPKIDDYYSSVSNKEDVWHHIKIVVSGNKAEYYLDNYDVATVNLENYNGGYVYLMCNTPGMKFKNLSIKEISYIESLEQIENIVVQNGTEKDALPLPNAVNATLGDGQNKSFNVTEWRCDGYNKDIIGSYIFTGTLDISESGIYEGDSNRFIKAVVLVADYDINATKEYTVSSEAQLNNLFDAYYIGNEISLDKNNYTFKQTNPSNVWAVTSGGGVRRSGAGDYDGTTSGHKGAAMLSFKEKQYEFELDFDYSFKGTTTGHKWMTVGVGAERQGITSYEAGGGSLMCVEQEGQIRMLQTENAPLITPKSAFKGYFETLTDKETSLNTWHHIKLAVKNAILYIYVDNYSVASVSLNNYSSGYVYIMGCTKDMEIKNIRLAQIKTAVCSADIPYRAVKKGTNMSAISLPQTLSVTADGNVVDCPVKWSCNDYNPDKEGTYIFYAEPIGKFSHYWLSDNSKRIIASVSVGNFDSDITQKFALTSPEEIRAYFASYFCETKQQITDSGAWRKTDPANTWSQTSEGVLSRAGTGIYEGGAKSVFGAAALYYKKRLTNFEVEFDYRHGKGGWRWFPIGFGAEAIGDTYLKNGYLTYVEREGDVNVVGSINGVSESFKNPFAGRFMEGYFDKVQAIWNGADEWCRMRLQVINKTLNVYIDNHAVWSCPLDNSYKGGYLYLITNSKETQIRNLSIVDYGAKNVSIASVQSAKDLGCEYQTVDKTKGEQVSLPTEAVVTDINGYTYNCPIRWESPANYRSGRLGSYSFKGIPIMPSDKFSNPSGAYITATVVISKVDFNPKTTVKYYFDTADDLRDFTGYYTANAGETDFAVSDWQNHWRIDGGKLQRINDDFKIMRDDKYNQYYKTARLTYNEALKGNYQIDIDYKKDTETWLWPMISLSIKDKTKNGIFYKNNEFAQQREGGTAIYCENEGYVNFWGNIDQSNQSGIRLRVTQMADKFVNYDTKQPHHMKITFIDGVARVYIDDYEANVAVRIPDAALGEYVGIMTNSNAASFDNFAITKLPDNAVEGIKVEADNVNIKFEKPQKSPVKPAESKNTASVLIAVAVAAAAAALIFISIFVFIKSNKKRS